MNKLNILKLDTTLHICIYFALYCAHGPWKSLWTTVLQNGGGRSQGQHVCKAPGAAEKTHSQSQYLDFSRYM